MTIDRAALLKIIGEMIAFIPFPFNLYARMALEAVRNWLTTEASAVAAVAAAPADLKEIIRGLFNSAADALSGRPFAARVVRAFGAFVADKLADRIWDRLFPAATEGGIAVLAAGPVDCAEFEAACRAAAA